MRKKSGCNLLCCNAECIHFPFVSPFLSDSFCSFMKLTSQHSYIPTYLSRYVELHEYTGFELLFQLFSTLQLSRFSFFTQQFLSLFMCITECITKMSFHEWLCENVCHYIEIIIGHPPLLQWLALKNSSKHFCLPTWFFSVLHTPYYLTIPYLPYADIVESRNLKNYCTERNHKFYNSDNLAQW